MNSGDQILVLNAGSSSLKLGVFAAGTEAQLTEDQISWDQRDDGGRQAAIQQLLARIDTQKVIAAGHRVVHGGARFTDSVLIDATVRAEIEELIDLAPLHNRLALEDIDAVSEAMPDKPQVAVFDTAFHATLPPRAYLYAVPYEWYQRWGIRRFGFHGLSHAYCAERAAELLERPLAGLKLVTCHLGSGCSLAAIESGRSIATTMGFTPLEGLVMATRPGNIDPGALTYVLDRGLVSLPELEDILSYQSGLLGVSGHSGDMRDILNARAAGDPRATLAFDLYVARLREAIAAMAATLGGCDALVFTGGVGEHASEVRAAACAGFRWIGLSLDEAANAAVTPDGEIGSPEARVRVLVLRAREDFMIARETARVLRGSL